MKKLIQSMLMLFVFTVSSNSNAGLIGEDVFINTSFAGSTSTVADPASEFIISGGGGAFIDIDITDTGLTLELFTGVGLTGIDSFNYVVTLLNPDLTFTSVTETFDSIISGSLFIGLSDNDQTASFLFTGHNFPTENTSYFARYDFVVADASAAPVSAPATLWLMGLGMMGLVGMRKNKASVIA